MTIYRGNALRVDMTDHRIERGETPENGIGGRTWNSVTLLRELEAGIDHRVDGGRDGLALHVHEDNKCVIQIEYDSLDHDGIRFLLAASSSTNARRTGLR